MCECKNVKIGSYANQVVLRVPKDLAITDSAGIRKEYVSVDKCLEYEIKHLWSLGIITTGCCCGHNINFGYIGVLPEFTTQMKELGYTIRYNSSRPEAEDSFYPDGAYKPKSTRNDTMELMCCYKGYTKALAESLEIFFRSPDFTSYKTVSDLFLRIGLFHGTCSSAFENCIEAQVIKKTASSYNTGVKVRNKSKEIIALIAFRKSLFRILLILPLIAGLALVAMMLWNILS